MPFVRDQSTELNLENYVILTGYVSDEELTDYYMLSDVFILASKIEGFGIVYLEALAYGKLVIAGNKDASVESLLSGELGVLIDPDNIEQIKDAIIKVLKKQVPERLLDPDYLRKRVIEEYGFDKFSKRVKEIIEKVIL